MKRLIMALAIAALGLAFSGSAEAFTQAATGSMNITGTILAACTVTTAPLNFGSFLGTMIVNVNSSVTVNCTSGTPYRIDLDGGQNMINPTDATRRMKTGTAPADLTNTVSYSLYKTSTLSVAGGDWGDNGATFCTTCTPVRTGKDGVGTGADDIHAVYGIVGTNTSPAGAYSDTVTVTLNY